jgi:urea carboxylase-associated protein 2
MTAVLEHTIPPGAAWSARVTRGRQIRLSAVADRANCSLLLFDATDPVDRMNIPDTLKAQYSARIRPPMVLMSDRGGALASMTGSSLDWHDALCGHGLDLHADRHGRTSYATDRNEWRRSARAGLLSELRKHGRNETDLHATVNLFSKVALDADAGFTFVPDHSRAGDWATLRTELDLVLIASTAPHPLDPKWSPAPVHVAVGPAAPVAADDASRAFRSESARALEQSERVFA